MRLAIIIVNWNGRDLLARCLRSIADTAGDLHCDVLVVDNGSTDGSQAMLRADFPAVRLIDSPSNLGFGGGNNLALREVLEARGLRLEDREAHPKPHSSDPKPQASSLKPHDYVVLLNPDTVVQPGALQALVAFMQGHQHVGVAGARLLNEDGSFQFSYARFPGLVDEFLILTGLGRRRHGPWYPSAGPQQSVRSHDRAEYAMGACLIARADATAEIGPLDEGFFMYSEEIDWCYRFRAAGWSVGYVADAPIVHLGGGSTRQVRPQMLAELYRSRVRFFQKHYGLPQALALRGLLLLMNGTKLLRARLRGTEAGGTPPLPWPLLRHALSVPPIPRRESRRRA
ncbi:MAG TPA: glycosyltransferase family 2 protein [Roseiflexaceae bacterium]|nr:glycosyltransferase family 2 protein [Roseiflexaceae bacterium]